jgi:hypothetical protein
MICDLVRDRRHGHLARGREGYSIMWATLALAAALQAPAQTGSFALKNPRPSYGILGQTRKDNKYLPGDLVLINYELQNLKPTDEGQVKYALSVEVATKAGKSVFKVEPQMFNAELTLGGTSRPASSYYEIPTDTAPGEYVLTITGSDQVAKDKPTSKLEFPFEVLPKRFGMVQSGINIPYDTNLLPTPPFVPTGQTIIVGTVVVGYELGPKDEKDPKKQQPNLFIKTTVLDESGKPTLAKPKSGGVMEIADQFKKAGMVPFTTPLELNRPGKYRIVIEVQDKIANKTAEQTLELTVYDVK